MAAKKKKAAKALKFWAVYGWQNECVGRTRYVQAATPEEAREKARQGVEVLSEYDGDRDWGKWQSEDFADLSDIEEVTEAEAKGETEPDAPNLPGLCPLWETIAPTMEEADPSEPGYLLGDIKILGVQFHVEAVKVKIGTSGPMACNMAHEEKLEAMLGLDLGGYAAQTVKIPDREGRWVLTIGPYAD